MLRAICCLILVFSPTVVLAEQIIVGHPESFEYKIRELAEGETINLVVHLKSSGVMLSGYKIALRRESDKQVVASIISDKNGLVKFSNLPANKYTVLYLGNPEVLDEDRVQIGDLILEEAKE
jgi:hypothetical protein